MLLSPPPLVVDISLVLVVVVPKAPPAPPLLPTLVTAVDVLVAVTDDPPGAPDLKVEE